MKTMRTLFFFFISILVALTVSSVAVSCISDEFSDSPSDILAFSTDTLRFDTVFTDLGTPTARLKVYNHASKAVNISRISMRSDDGIFSMNVDGVSGKTFENVEIRARDSIFVFVECLIPASGDPRPFKMEGLLDFVTNGVTQSVCLEAYGQNVRRLRGVTIETDAVFTSEMPYVVFDTLRVAEGATLTLSPGTQLLFHDKGILQVEGRLLALGETGRMVSMRGDRLDDVLPDTGYEILAGQWQGVRFGPSSFGNRMEYVEMQSTVHGVVVDSCGVSDHDKLTLVNSWLHNSQGNVLRAEHAKVYAYGCCFSDAGEAVVWLRGGEHEFLQCTIANYYLFAISPESILTLSHLFPEEKPAASNPLMKASFENCIIYGMTSPLTPGDLEGTDVFMRNVLLGVDGSDDSHFLSCLWDENPLFETVRDDYYFNYRLKEDSPAIGAGNPDFVVPICLKDMDGVDRLEWGNPALGAYAR
ncbi:MAG: hypothetical protein K2H72_02060 [Muribaculaceae bacterium]|nr:hypothetical protein [Muribaculaceae bacterium]